MSRYKPMHEQRSSKCFVLVLASFVILCAALLIFASIVRFRNPQVKLTSATLTQIRYNSASSQQPQPQPGSSSFNATLITRLSIKNPNFGGFSYENTTVSVLYEGARLSLLGDRGAKIGSGRVEGRETKGMSVRVTVIAGNRISGDVINSGTLNLTSYVRFSGNVQLLKIMNKRMILEMACVMNLNLTSLAVHGIQC